MYAQRSESRGSALYYTTGVGNIGGVIKYEYHNNEQLFHTLDQIKAKL